jgi:hypothetical protein
LISIVNWVWWQNRQNYINRTFDTKRQTRYNAFRSKEYMSRKQNTPEQAHADLMTVTGAHRRGRTGSKPQGNNRPKRPTSATTTLDTPSR